MSIAVSTVVRPSRLLSGLLAGMCMCVIFIGCLTGFGLIGNLGPVERIAIAAICFATPVFIFFRIGVSAKVHAIHVSGIGQIRLSVLNDETHEPGAALIAAERGDVVHLMPASTLWPCLLILHLRHENGRTSIMTILPDSVSIDSFRALLVACRWIVGRRIDEAV